MSDYIKQITSIEQKIQDNRTELAKLTERGKMLKEEKIKLLDELKTLNIDEKELEQKIAELEGDIESELKECEEKLK